MAIPLTPAEQYELMQIDKELRESPPETPEEAAEREALEEREHVLSMRWTLT